MTFYIAPVGTPMPTEPLVPASWTELESLDEISLGFDAVSDALVAVGRESFSASLKLSRLESARLLGIPYKHPRQILHNGRKP